MEEWRDIRGYPTYAVSTEGRVRHNRINRFLIQRPDRFGHHRVLLTTKDGQVWLYVDELVASHFFRHYSPTMTLEHIDGDPSNCRIYNLRPYTEGGWRTIPEAPQYEMSPNKEVRRIGNRRAVHVGDRGLVKLYERNHPITRSANKIHRELFGRD